MRLTSFPLIVASSLVLAGIASAATRPRYGGTLHVATQTAPASLDPANPNQSDWIESRNVFNLIFDTLVTLDDRGRPKAALATSWQPEAGNQRWQFLLRRGIAFQDGSPLNSEVVAASLRAVNPEWKVFPSEDGVIIERNSPAPDLPAELALTRNSIVKRESGNTLGTGPFTIRRWDPGKRLVLAARDDYWGGRAFLDSVEIEMGKSLYEQTISFDLGKLQVMERAPGQAHPAPTESLRVESSAPVELIALLFNRDPESPQDAQQRKALALSIDRELLNRVVLQGRGEAASGLLPNWLTGYEFLFPANADLLQAQQERAEIPRAAVWTLTIEANDPVARLLAERIILSAGDAGLRLQLVTTQRADIQLVRLPLVSLDTHVALDELARRLNLPQPKFGRDTVDELYAAENTLLQGHHVIPLLHVRTAFAVSEDVRIRSDWRDGAWDLRDVWLEAEKP